MYQVFQKSIARDVNPGITLVITYLTALIISLIIIPFFPMKKTLLESIKDANWASYLLAFSIVGVEIGYLFVYRAGWNMSMASAVSSALCMILLIPIGYLFFKESISMINILGVSLCALGVYLIILK